MTNHPTNSDGSWVEGDKIFNVANIIHGYNLMILIGVVICFGSIVFFWRRMKYSWTILQIMLIIAVPTGIFGARLWDVIWDGGWSNFFNFAGLSIHGGVMAGMICTSPYVWRMRRQVDFRTVFAIVLPNILVAQSIGRFGNFFNHELFGGIVAGDSLNWMGLMKSHMFINGAYRAPMFFYESMSSLGGWVLLVLLLLRKNWLRPGVVGALYWIWYGIWRTVFEPMKAEPWVVNGFQVSAFISIASIVFGSLLGIYWQWLCRQLPLIVFKHHKARLLFNWINVIFKWWNDVKFAHRPREYEKITPVKPRRKYEFFGPKTDFKKQYVLWGQDVMNKVIIWLPITPEEKWSKRELNRGEKPKAKRWGFIKKQR